MTKGPELTWKLRALEAKEALRVERARTEKLEQRLVKLEAEKVVWLNKNVDLHFRLAKIWGAYS